jgi:asparagine synthase (glutamine-hydrolysing)
MCGISGYFSFSGPVEDTSFLRVLNRAVAHRGPDGEGMAFVRRGGAALLLLVGERTALTPDLPAWKEDLKVVHDAALGHRRFAIIDPSAGGHQPFWSVDGAVGVCFNGEIYNYRELKRELQAEGHVFATRSDAEVLLHAYRQWGEGCFERMRGFWALALWDARWGLLLSRDRLGKAPLYYARHAGRLWFCSEIKGLRAVAGSGAFPPRLEAVRQFVRAGLRDVGDETFFQGIRTFPKASHAWVKPDGSFEARSFWAPPAHRLSRGDLGEDEALRGLEERLVTAVDLRLRADVPIGLELSGGLDSSALAALAVSARGNSELRRSPAGLHGQLSRHRLGRDTLRPPRGRGFSSRPAPARVDLGRGKNSR